MFDNTSKSRKEIEAPFEIVIFYLFEFKDRIMNWPFIDCHLYLMLDCRDVMSRLGAFTNIGFVR